jgi:hypothetical protein
VKAVAAGAAVYGRSLEHRERFRAPVAGTEGAQQLAERVARERRGETVGALPLQRNRVQSAIHRKPRGTGKSAAQIAELVGRARFERATNWLKASCSTG